MIKIRETLEKVMGSSELITIWQHSTKDTFQLEAKFISIEEDTCEIKVNCENADLGLNDIEPLYLHCTNQDIIFKRDKFYISKNTIKFKFPSEMMIKERRRLERFRFKYQDFKLVNIRVDNPKEDTSAENSFMLIDISTAGLALVGSAVDLENVRLNDFVKITKITDQNLVEHIDAKIVCKSLLEEVKNPKEYFDSEEIMRIGVEFSEAMESVSFKSVSDVITRTQTRSQGLKVSGFNGLGSKERQRILNKAAEDNKVLAAQLRDQIEQIDKLRYLTAEMKKEFWLDVNRDLLAQALRLATKELIFDLLDNVTDNIRNEFLEKLDEPRALSSIEKAQRQVCEYISKKEKDGSFVLSAKSFVKYV